MRNPKFSIIIPVYNVAPYLRECLDSVLAQTVNDPASSSYAAASWEAICVDDGSTDGSEAILDEYSERFNVQGLKFNVIHQANAGVSAARNAGLEVATGEWVMFLDADDVWSARCLETIEQVAASYNDAELIRFKQVNFTETIRFESKEGSSAVEIIDISKEIKMTDFFDTLFWGYAYRRDIIRGRRFPPYKRGEDRVFLNGIQLFSANKIHVVDSVLYGYRQRATSQMHTLPSVRVIVDEMSHRCDIVKMIESSSKKVVYAGSWWLEGYFTQTVGSLIAAKTLDERKWILREWFRCMREMKYAKGISLQTRLVYLICYVMPIRMVWWLLCRALPWYTTHGIVPRVARKVIRYARN